MRRLAGTIALVTVLAAVPAPASGHPGHGPSEVQVGDDFFRSDDLLVATGDTVVWRWLGPAGNHSVTADPGQAESFDSDPGRSAAQVDHAAGFTFTHRFTRAGAFTYHCRVHPAMTARVTVVELAPRDSVRPVIRAAGVRPARVCADSAPGCRATRGYLNVRMSERSTVVGRIDRAARGRWRLLRTFDFDAAKGRDRHRVHVRGFEPGPYRIRLVAYDAVGNRSRSKVVRFKVGAPG